MHLRRHAGNVGNQRNIFAASANFNRKRTAGTDEQPDWALVMRKALAKVVGLDLWIVVAQFGLARSQNLKIC